MPKSFKSCLNLKNLKPRGTKGLFARRNAERLSLENLLFRAQHLPKMPRAILVAHFDNGVRTDDLATLHNIPRSRLSRKISQWRDTLSDPCFLLAAQFADHLPPLLRDLAKDHWIEGRSLRDLAASRQLTLHKIRLQLQTARALLLLEMRGSIEIDSAAALAMLQGKPRPSSPPAIPSEVTPTAAAPAAA